MSLVCRLALERCDTSAWGGAGTVEEGQCTLDRTAGVWPQQLHIDLKYSNVVCYSLLVVVHSDVQSIIDSIAQVQLLGVP
jgi:hypothetical protein